MKIICYKKLNKAVLHSYLLHENPTRRLDKKQPRNTLKHGGN